MRLVPHASRILAVAVLLVLAFPHGGRAQLVEGSPFTVYEKHHEGAIDPDVAVGADSSMEFLWTQMPYTGSFQHVMARHFASDGTASGPAIRLDDGSEPVDVFNPTLEPDTRGGFIASWRRWTGLSSAIDARLIDAAGAPGPIFTPFSGTGGYASWLSSFTGFSTGAIATWAQEPFVFAQRYDAAGQPVGPTILVRQYGALGSVPTVAVATSNGGFVVLWEERDPDDYHYNPTAWARPYDAAGQPLAAAVALTDVFGLANVAASPLGGFALIGTRSEDTYRYPSGVWFARFATNAAPLGPPTLVAQLDRSIAGPARGGFDPSGRLFVVWGLGSSSVGVGPAGRFYDAAGAPLARAFQFSDRYTRILALSPRPDGRFVVAAEGTDDVYATILSPCAPPAHTGCGNGVVDSPCEGCDQGAANSDVLPNACRTHCQVASCGDGVVDAGEQCDDGNNVGCDDCDASCHLEVGHVCGDGIAFAGCGEECDDGPANDDTTADACRTSCLAPTCGDGVLDSGEGCDDGNAESCDSCSDACVPEPGLVCGDGIIEFGCGEECEDGNAVVGDGCSTACKVERILGGGSPVSECIVEWSIDNTANEPRFDKRGGFNGVQTCVDGDSRCDFDGVAGTCTFHVRVCANNTDIAACYPDMRLQSWILRKPSAANAVARPELADVRVAFGGINGDIVGPAGHDKCSGVASVPVRLKASVSGAKRGIVALKSEATLYPNGLPTTATKDKDTLKLVCLPAS